MAIIGDADVIVGADASGLGKELRAKAASEFQAAGKALAESFRQSFQSTATKIGDDLSRAFPKVTSVAKSAFEGIQNIGSSALNGLKGTVDGVQAKFTQFGDKAAGAIGNIVDGAISLPGPLGNIAVAAVTAFGKALEGAKSFAQGFRDPNAATEKQSGLLTTLGGVARTTFSSMGKAVTTGFVTVAQKGFDLLKSGAEALWKVLANGAKSAAQTAGQAIKVGLSSASKAASAAIMGGVVTALTKGFQRLDGLNKAEARLKGLGLAGDTTAKIMEGVDKAVTGTAFGMADAAQTAGLLATAGIKAGKQMDGALQAVVATAAGAGAELNEIGPIFSKIAASGKVSGDAMAQMLARGINASGALQKELGKTADEITKMVSSGEIDFDTFVKAINNDLGLLAESMGGTLGGMVSNVGAQMGRIGAELQKPIFNALLNAMPGVLQGFRNIATAVAEFMAPLEDKLIPVAEKFGQAFERVTSSLDSEGIGNFITTLAPLLPLLGAIVGTSGGLLSSLPVIGGLFEGLSGPIGLAAGALVMLFAISPDTLSAGIENLMGMIGKQLPGLVTKAVGMIQTMLENLVSNLPMVIEGLGQVVQEVVPIIAQALPTVIGFLAQSLAELIPTLITTLIELIPVLIDGAVQLFMGLVQGLERAVPPLIVALLEAIPQLVTTLIGAAGQILEAGITLFTGLISAIGTIVPQLIKLVIELAPKIITELLNAVPLLLETALELFESLVEAFVETVPELITEIVAMLPELVSTLLGFIPDLIKTGIELFLTLVTAVIKALPQILTAVIGMLPEILSMLISMIPDLIITGIEVFLALVTAIVKALPDILEALWDMLPEIISALIDMIPALIDAGKDLILGLAEGIAGSASAVWDAIVGAVSGAIDWAKNLLGISSPSKVFDQIGKWSGEGLRDGINDMAKDVERASGQLANAAVKGLKDIKEPTMSVRSLMEPSDSLKQAMDFGLGGSGFKPLNPSSTQGNNDNSRTVVIEEGAIVVKGDESKKTSLDVLDRIVEEIDL